MAAGSRAPHHRADDVPRDGQECLAEALDHLQTRVNRSNLFSLWVAVTLFALLSLIAEPARAQISDGVVKIGVLNDEFGPYAASGGPGSRVAALMAVEDFGAAAKGL